MTLHYKVRLLYPSRILNQCAYLKGKQSHLPHSKALKDQGIQFFLISNIEDQTQGPLNNLK